MERIDDLQLDGLKIVQDTNGYGFTSDSVLLANFVKAKHSDICVEIGSGSGIISILVNYKEKPKKIYAFEIQEGAYNLMVKNIKSNNMNDTIQPINSKVQNWKNYLDSGCANIVFVNPPYFKYDENVVGENEIKNISRFDKYLTFKDLFECVGYLLKNGGKLYFICLSNRIYECFYTMKKYNITPKKIYFVHPNENKNSTVFLCEAVKGGKDDLIVMPPLFTNNLDGDYIQTIQKLYKK